MAIRREYLSLMHKKNCLSGCMTKKCMQHKTSDSQKFLVFDKVFKGKLFWSKQKLQSKLIDVENCNELKTREYLNENGNLKVYDFVRYHRAHYSDRFLMEYRNPNPSIFSYQFQKELQKIMYTTKRQVSSVPDNKQVLLLFSLIKNLNIKYAHELPLPKFENILQLEKYLQPKSLRIKSSSTDTINMKLSPLLGDVIVHNFKKLMQKADRFDIGANENVDDFEKSLEGSRDNYESSNVSDECSATYFVADKPAHDVHPKILYREILKHSKQRLQSPPCRKKKQKTVAVNNLEPPPVPKNSHISVTCQDSSLVPEACGQRVVSHSEFLRNVNKHLSLGKDRSISQKQIEVIHEKFPSNIVEWRKPISAMETGSSVSFPFKNVAKSVPVSNKDKGVCTTTAFDLFFDNCQEAEEDIASLTKSPSSSKEDPQKHGKVSSPEFTWQQFDTYGKGIKKSETLNAESKQSKLMTGVQAIESYNQVYDKFKTLHKDAQKDMKRFTELQRTIGEKQSLRRTSAVTELQIQERFLPLILSSTQQVPSRRVVNNELSTTDVSSSKVEKLSSIRTIKEDGSQSRTLKPLSHEEKFLKYVLPEIEQGQGRFYINLIGRDESECNSATTKASLDVHCHSIEKDCFCPSQNINGKPERSDVKTSRGSRKFSKLNKES